MKDIKVLGAVALAASWFAYQAPSESHELATEVTVGERLQFGTAGLRGALGPGPNRMNRANVRRVTAGLAAYLLDPAVNAREVMAHGYPVADSRTNELLPKELLEDPILYPAQELLDALECGAAATLTDPNRAELLALAASDSGGGAVAKATDSDLG